MLTWLHIGDPHAADVDGWDSVETLALIAREARGLGDALDFIFLPGDIANHGEAEQYRRVAEALAAAPQPVAASRLYNSTSDHGMKQMLHYMIARDTMHQEQWLAVIEELGGEKGTLPIPNSLPQEKEDGENNYSFYDTGVEGSEAPQGRWTSGPSLDGKGEFTVFKNRPMGEEPKLGPARPDSGAETQQIG